MLFCASSGSTFAMILRGIRDANVQSASLAARFVTAPRLADPDKATLRLSGWLSDISLGQAAGFEELFGYFPHARQIFASVAESSPYLFELIRSDAACTLRILRSEPDRHLTELTEEARQHVGAAASEAQ